MMQDLKSLDDLEACLADSETRPVLLFKHSTTCPISASAYRRVAEYIEDNAATAPPCYLVKVIESRPVSNAIAARLGVTHQSPQALIVHRGVAQWHNSHGAVTGPAIQSALAELA